MIKTDTLVEVRPLDTEKWHGKKGKENFAQPKTLEVLFDRKTGGYATGLTPEEAEHYGKILGVDLSNVFSPDSPHPYWSSKASWITLPNHTKVFDMKKPAEYVKIKNMKASSRVANSLKDYEDGLYPEATHYIVDEVEEIAGKAIMANHRKEAYLMLDKMTDTDKTSMIQILSKKNLKGRTADFINAEIDEIQLDKERLEPFLRYAKMGREEVNLRATLLVGLSQNVLTKEGESIFYMSELLGIDIDQAIKWFKDPNNQKLKVAILDKIK